jgi:hypothetical protein
MHQENAFVEFEHFFQRLREQISCTLRQFPNQRGKFPNQLGQVSEGLEQFCLGAAVERIRHVFTWQRV